MRAFGFLAKRLALGGNPIFASTRPISIEVRPLCPRGEIALPNTGPLIWPLIMAGGKTRHWGERRDGGANGAEQGSTSEKSGCFGRARCKVELFQRYHTDLVQ